MRLVGASKFASFEQSDARAKEQSFAKVMRDENDCFAEPLLDGEEFLLYFGASKRIERAKWLIHQQNRRVSGQSTSDANALPLAAGKFPRMARSELRRLEANDAEHFSDTFFSTIFRPMLEFRNKTDVSFDREVGEQARFLDDITDFAAQPNGIPFGCCPALDKDFAGVWLKKAVYEFQRGSFSRAAAAKQDQCFAFASFDGEVLENWPTREFETNFAKGYRGLILGAIHAVIVA